MAVWALLKRVYLSRYSLGFPLLVALGVGITAGLCSPDGLATRDHGDYDAMVGTVGQLIGTLLVALAVEARTPFVRTSAVPPRILAAIGAIAIGTGAFASVLVLSPDLPCELYAPLFGTAMGGLAGGLAAVVQLGIALALRSTRELEQEALIRLARGGDPEARAHLDNAGVPWRE